MNEKRAYAEPELDVIEIREDILTSSGGDILPPQPIDDDDE